MEGKDAFFGITSRFIALSFVSTSKPALKALFLCWAITRLHGEWLLDTEPDGCERWGKKPSWNWGTGWCSRSRRVLALQTPGEQRKHHPPKGDSGTEMKAGHSCRWKLGWISEVEVVSTSASMSCSCSSWHPEMLQRKGIQGDHWESLPYHFFNADNYPGSSMVFSTTRFRGSLCTWSAF